MTLLSPARLTLLKIAGIAVLIGLILYQAGFFARGQIPPGETPLPPAPAAGATITVQSEEAPIVYRSVGRIRSRDEIDIAARVLARVLEVKVRSGDAVKKGDLLVMLDDRDLGAGIQQAREAVASAQAALDLADKERKRAEDLAAQGVITKQKLDQAVAGQRQAQANLAAAEQALRQLETNLAYTRIESPIEGIVAERLVDPGDLASPGRILLRLFDPKRLMIEAAIRESLAAAVRLGAKVPIEVPAVNGNFEAGVREIVPAIDPASRTFLIKACLGEVPALRPGMSATLRLTLGSEPAIFLPERAVRRAGQIAYATVLQNGRPRRALLRTAAAENGKVRVFSGLAAGDQGGGE
ncbi:MAG: efflux RND transporter periplasmic adaptor subunit [Planctomycetota bacterium]|nr:efflux RND transporter periplasmic adaptor subunit [Planctomycetota bacterium]